MMIKWWIHNYKKKINAAADTAAYLVQDQAGEWICAICGLCVSIIESSFLRVRVRCRQASLLLLLWKKTHVQLDNHLSVPSLNKYENHLYIRISCKYCTWQDKTQFESISFVFFGECVGVFVYMFWYESVLAIRKWALRFDLFKDLTHTHT